MRSVIRQVWGSPNQLITGISGDFAMVWTMSAKLGRSYAQCAGAVGSMLLGAQLNAPSRFAGAALIQSVLVIGLVGTLSLDVVSKDAAIAQAAGALAVLMSIYVGYLVVRRPHDDLVWPDPSEVVARGGIETISTWREQRSASELEQIILLKARVSHELRTPLNAVVGFADMMHREVLGPVGNDRYREYAGHIARSAEHFQDATEKTLAVAELLATPQNPRRSSFGLNGFVAQSLTRFRAETDKRAPSWDVDVPEAFTVVGNHSALGEALYHLWDAGYALSQSQGGTTAIVVARLQSHGIVELCFTLCDVDGARASTETEAVAGADLSLLLARLGVEAGGGRLSIKTEPGEDWQATLQLEAGSRAAGSLRGSSRA